jgi:CrcB protein
VTGSAALLVAVGAAVGAPARYLLDSWVTARFGDRLPWGTLLVNLLGSAALGAVTGLAVDDRLGAHGVALLGTGLCGAFTTASTFAWEVVSLHERDEPRARDGRGWAAATTYVVLSVLLGVGLAAATYGALRG